MTLLMKAISINEILITWIFINKTQNRKHVVGYVWLKTISVREYNDFFLFSTLTSPLTSGNQQSSVEAILRFINSMKKNLGKIRTLNIKH